MIDVISPSVPELTGILDPEAIGVVALDGADTVRHSNPAGARLLGGRPDELVGVPLGHLVRTVDPAFAGVAALTRRVRQGAAWSGVLEAAQPHGDVARFDATMSVLSGASRPSALALVCVDADATGFGPLGWFALHDPLTGLANRALLADRLELAIAQTARSGGLVAVVFVDLDGFKSVNDTLGHLEGDRVLRAMADRVRHLLRPSDTLARFGGDEFVAVCEVPSMCDIQEIVDRLATLAVVEVVPGWTIGVSIGVAISSRPGAGAHELLQQADAAMFCAKRSGHPEFDLSVG